MARDKDYGASGASRTCLWCGVQLNGQYQREMERVSLPGGGFHIRLSDKRTLTGYGQDSEGLFCRTRCGYQFAVAAVRNGYRLHPAS